MKCASDPLLQAPSPLVLRLFIPEDLPLVPFQGSPPPWLRAFYRIARNALAVVLSATTLQVVAELVL